MPYKCEKLIKLAGTSQESSVMKLHRHYKQEIYLSELKRLTGNAI